MASRLVQCAHGQHRIAERECDLPGAAGRFHQQNAGFNSSSHVVHDKRARLFEQLLTPARSGP